MSNELAFVPSNLREMVGDWRKPVPIADKLAESGRGGRDRAGYAGPVPERCGKLRTTKSSRHPAWLN